MGPSLLKEEDGVWTFLCPDLGPFLTVELVDP